MRKVTQLRPGVVPLLVAGAALVGASALLASFVTALVLMAAGATLISLGGIIAVFALVHRRAERRRNELIAQLVGHDPSPCFTTDAAGRPAYFNAAAAERFGGADPHVIGARLGDLFAEPAAVFERVLNAAAAHGSGREDVATRCGRARLSAHGIGHEQFLWRLEEIAETEATPPEGPKVSLPVLTLSAENDVLFMNAALRRLAGGQVRTLGELFAHLPLHHGEQAELRGANGPVRVIVAELEPDGWPRDICLVPVGEGNVALPVDHTDFEEIPVALARIAPDGTVRAANRLARDLLELQPGEKASVTDLLEGLGRPLMDWLADAMSGRAVGRPEVLRATRPESESFLQVTLRRVVDHGQAGLVAVLSDATELKTLEAKFVQSQKMQAIGQLAGGVAHDFNNLLTAIAGHCDLLLMRHARDDPDYADLVQINQNANRAASLVGQLLAFSRKQTLKAEIINLTDTLGDLIHLLDRLVGERVTLSLTHAAELPSIRADPRQLEQVLVNLVVNARDAMPMGGEIRIETEARSLRQELRRDRAIVPPGDYVLIHVRDEGTGIPPDKLDKIFEPFFTTKGMGEGTGLGLSTVYGIVKQSGGFIFADSTPGKGSTFTLYLAKHDGPATIPPTPIESQTEQNARTGDGVILLVEDEAPVRAFASRALRMRGYTVLEAESAEMALETLKDPHLKVDLFVSDVIMPGMDGPSWVREARRARPDVRVVFVSGYAEDSVLEIQRHIPNSVFLAKPFSLNELTETVQAQIH